MRSEREPPRLTPEEFVRIAKALADPQRCDILERTASAGEMCCATLVAESSLAQATVSHHLKELATAGLLSRRKEGQFGYYRFCPEVLSAYLAELGRRMGVPANGAGAPKRKSVPARRDV